MRPIRPSSAFQTNETIHAIVPVFVVFCAVLLTRFNYQTSHPFPPDPSYTLPPSPSCPPPPSIRHRPGPSSNCIYLTDSTPVSLSLRLNLPLLAASLTVQRLNPSCQSPSSQLSLNSSAQSIHLRDLVPDESYEVSIRQTSGAVICQSVFSTPFSKHNLFSNPSFEHVQPPLHPAFPAHGSPDMSPPRAWTSFYNGRARRVCGALVAGNTLMEPREGNCVLGLGGAQPGMFHGAYQGVWVEAGRVRVEAFVRAVDIEWLDGINQRDRMSLVIATEGDDGILLPLENTTGNGHWSRVCVEIEKEKEGYVHVFFHLHHTQKGELHVDDVSMQTIQHHDPQCYRDRPRVQKQKHIRKLPEDFNLKPEIESDEVLTVAVAMTAERVLRLETLSREYGGGRIVAAVGVRNNEQLHSFSNVWRRKAWLRRHVSVVFVQMEKGKAVAINALRNVAVGMVETEFVALLDVDMVGTIEGGWGCMRQKKWLEGVVGAPEEKRFVVMPTMMVDVHTSITGGKSALRKRMKGRVGAVYCGSSQKANRLKRWWHEDKAVETRWMRDYEPYGVGRRVGYPEYDERFAGYGLNKIAWAYAASRGGWRLYVASDAWVTHLNHVENAWVSGIDVDGYVTTWRRFLAFVEESSGGRRPVVEPIPYRHGASA